MMAQWIEHFSCKHWKWSLDLQTYNQVECRRSLIPGLFWPEGGGEIQILEVQGPATLTNTANQQRVCFKQGTDIRGGSWTLSPLYTAGHTHAHLQIQGGGIEGER